MLSGISAGTPSIWAASAGQGLVSSTISAVGTGVLTGISAGGGGSRGAYIGRGAFRWGRVDLFYHLRRR